MIEPGLDGRHRDKTPPKAGEIQQKSCLALNGPVGSARVRLGRLRRQHSCLGSRTTSQC